MRQLSGPSNLTPGMERQYTELNVLGPERLLSSGYSTTASTPALSSYGSLHHRARCAMMQDFNQSVQRFQRDVAARYAFKRWVAAGMGKMEVAYPEALL